MKKEKGFCFTKQALGFALQAREGSPWPTGFSFNILLHELGSSQHRKIP